MSFSKKGPWWLAPALLLALGCNDSVNVKKFEVADEDSSKTEEPATKSNGEFAGKSGDDEMSGKPSGDEVAAKTDTPVDDEMTEQESGKKPSTKKPAVKEEDDKPAPKTLADLELPKDGKAEDYEKFVETVLANQPRSEADKKTFLALLGGAAEKILELEKDTTSDRWKMANSINLQVQLSEVMPKAKAVAEAEGEEKEKAKKELQTALDKYLEPLKSRKPDEVLVEAIGRLVQGLSGSPDDALIEINKGIADLFATKLDESDNEEIKKTGKMLKRIARMPEGMKRLAKLPGNEMELTGKTTTGEDFDLKQWKGKVVLVDFWATWCGPCVAEYPNMLKNYKAYHDKGFEIIGISADEELEKLTTYLEKKKVPWPNMYVEGGHPANEYYGIPGYPTMILIGRDGKVISMEARGPELDALLEAQFAEAKPEGEKKPAAEEKKEEPKPEEPKADEPKAEEPKKEEPKKEEAPKADAPPTEKKEEPKL